METDRYHLADETTVAAPANTIDWEFQIKKVLRTLQINVPFLQDLRFAFQRWYRTVTNTVCEPDFDALPLIRGLDNSIVVDIGANRGDTIHSIKMRTQNCQVMAFEPNSLVYSRLSRVYKRCPDVKLFNFGLSDKDDIMSLNIPFYKNFMFDGLASFNAESALNWLKGRIFFYSQKYLRIRLVDCCLTRLDRFEVNPVFIKIDVQGFEYQVLAGSIETLRRSRPVVLVETPTGDALRLLNELEYSPYNYRDGKLKPGYGDLNTFFLPSEKAGTLLRD